MPVFAADVLPDTAGRNLGNPYQRWNHYAQNLDVLGAVSYAPVIGAGMSPSGAIYVATTPVTAAANTTADQNLCTCTIPAGLLNSPGRILRSTVGGTYTTQAGQAPTFGFAVQIGAPALGLWVFGVISPPLSAGQPNNVWRGQWELIVYTTGTSGQLDCHGTLTYQPTNGQFGGTALIDWDRTTPVGPIDLTIAQPLLCVAEFSTNTSPANSVTQREFIVEVLN